MRSNDELHVLGEILQVEVVVYFLHLSDRSCNFGLAEHSIEERILEDAAQEGHVPEARAEAVPRGGAGFGDHHGRLRLRGRLHLLLGRPGRRLCAFGRRLRGLGCVHGRLLRLLLRIHVRLHGVPRLLPRLGLLALLVRVADPVEDLGGGIHDTLEQALRLPEHSARRLGGARTASLHELGCLSEALALLCGLVELLGDR
mmetsp:Transcript_93008/g.242494  ORF Transcript_93008/g.242494 Transcript_93008/m.242494 type:complete len:200 (+) Transcript_93008:424-1023(+)